MDDAANFLRFANLAERLLELLRSQPAISVSASANPQRMTAPERNRNDLFVMRIKHSVRIAPSRPAQPALTGFSRAIENTPDDA